MWGKCKRTKSRKGERINAENGTQGGKADEKGFLGVNLSPPSR